MPVFTCCSSLCTFFSLVFLSNSDFGLFFATICISCARFDSIESLWFALVARGMGVPSCGCFCADGRQATVKGCGQQGVFISLWSVSSSRRQEGTSMWYI